MACTVYKANVKGCVYVLCCKALVVDENFVRKAS